MRGRPLCQTTLLGLVMLATFGAGPATAQPEDAGVLSPEAPAGVEYALPDARARRETAGAEDRARGATPALFGVGIERPPGRAPDPPGEVAPLARGQVPRAPSRAPAGAVEGEASGPRQGGKAVPRQAGEARPSGGEGSPAPGAVMVGAGGLTLLVGGACGLAARGRRKRR